jgi:hypothetical protein
MTGYEVSLKFFAYPWGGQFRKDPVFPRAMLSGSALILEAPRFPWN